MQQNYTRVKFLTGQDMLKNFLKFIFYPSSILFWLPSLSSSVHPNTQWLLLLGPPGQKAIKKCWECLGIYSGGSRREQLAAWYTTSSRCTTLQDRAPLGEGSFANSNSCVFLKHLLALLDTPQGRTAQGCLLYAFGCCRATLVKPQD